jgi:hypothetical protein
MSLAQLRESPVFPLLARHLAGPVVYVGVDPHYGLGPEQWLADYSMVCRHETAVLPMLRDKNIKVFCLQQEIGDGKLPGRATAGLAHHPLVLEFLQAQARRGPLSILLFKPSAQIDELCAQHGFRVLGAPARIARPMENKVNFFRLLDGLGLPHPAWNEVDLREVDYDALSRKFGRHVVIQGAHGFSGNRTFDVTDGAAFAIASAALRHRRARVSQYVEGRPMTLNGCVFSPDLVLTNRLFHQVTGVPECTVYKLGACGNDWMAEPASEAAQQAAAGVAQALGRELGQRGFRGTFGVDFVVNGDTVAAIEVNPRLVSSVPMASDLEVSQGLVPLLLFHCLATAGCEHELQGFLQHYESAPRLDGAQMVLHNLTGSAAVVDGVVAAGLHQLEGEALRFVRPAFHVSECGPDEVLVLPAARGHMLAEAGECARVQMRRPVLTWTEGAAAGPGSLTGEAKAVARAVYAALALRPCTVADGGEGSSDDE